MRFFVWDPHFSTGLPELDEQHRGLIDIFNALHGTLFDAGVGEADRDTALRRAFDKLMGYARQQFAAEESLMRELGLDERHQSLHRRQHEQFIINLRELWADRSNERDLHGRLMGFLVSWIGLHVLGVDPSMARQVRDVRAGRSPADAYEHDPGISEQAQRALLNMVGRLYTALAAQAQARDNALAAAAAVTASAQALQNRLSAQGVFDPDMAAGDARYFHDRLAAEVARAFRSESPLSVVLLDITWPAAGSSVPSEDRLPTITRAVAGAMKRSTDLVARLGEHRVAVLLPDTDQDGAASAAQRVLGDLEFLARVRAGVAGSVPRSREHGPVLLAEAEAALQANAT